MGKAKRVAVGALSSAWWSARYVLYVALFYARFLVVGALRLFSSLCLLGFLFGLVLMSKHSMTYGMLGYGVAAFVVALVYDTLVLWIKPDDGTEIDLWH